MNEEAPRFVLWVLPRSIEAINFMINFKDKKKVFFAGVVTLGISAIAVFLFLSKHEPSPITQKNSRLAKINHVEEVAPTITEANAIAVDEVLDDEKVELDATSSVVSQYKDLEKVGTPQARLKMALLIDDCGFGVDFFSSEEQIRELESFGARPELVQEVRGTFVKCKGLFQHLGEDVDFRELSTAWLQDSAISGDVVAELLSLYRYPDSPTPEEVKPLLFESLAYAQDNQELKGVVYRRAMVFYGSTEAALEAAKSEPYADDFRRGVTRDSWYFLYCQYAEKCDFDKESELYLSNFYEYEYEEALAGAKALEEAIEKGEWEKTGLN